MAGGVSIPRRGGEMTRLFKEQKPGAFHPVTIDGRTYRPHGFYSIRGNAQFVAGQLRAGGYLVRVRAAKQKAGPRLRSHTVYIVYKVRK